MGRYLLKSPPTAAAN